MRSETGVLWDVWNRGGPFIGEVRAIGRVTIEADYRLERDYIGDPNRQPVRWFQRSIPPLPLYDHNVVSVGYDDSWWGTAVNVQIVTATDSGPRAGGAPGWPDPLAYWVWPVVGDTIFDDVPTGTAYFRTTFNSAATVATVYATGDNVFDLYIDGALVLSSGPDQLYGNKPAWATTFEVDISLTAGEHTIAIRGRNIAQFEPFEAELADNPAALIACVIAAGGGVLVRTDSSWQSVGYLQSETELPNIRSINMDRSLDTDAATCDITMSNQWMRSNTGSLGPSILNDAGPDPRVLGEPGFFSPGHGASAESRSRWKQSLSTWSDALVPNALVRTYQGYGGAYPMGIDEAVAAGYLVLTGVWLVDEVRVGSNGEISLRCRDMAKLLIEQLLYPPLVPTSVYPLRYCRWEHRNETREQVVESVVAAPPGGLPGDRALVYDTSANLAWYSSGAAHGHHPGDAFDGKAESFYLSVGNSGPSEPYAVEWVQATCGEVIDAVWVSPWAGNYTCYVSVMVDGDWVDGGFGDIPYSEAGVGRYNGAYEARIKYVAKAGVPWEAPVSIQLPSAYRAEKVRFTFTNLAHSQWGPYPYRAGARELRASLSGGEGGANQIKREVQTVTETVKYDGNYKDFADIVRDLLLWSGWHLYSDGATEPALFGNIESTGSYAEDCFPDDTFDKRPVIDAITAVKELVGYIFWVDEDGGARFESPNWWSPGNFLQDTGQHTLTVPEIDERLQLTDYSVSLADAAARSHIVIGSNDPYAGIPGALITRFTPSTAASLKGMVKPAFWPSPVQMTQPEQQTMGELIAMHIWFRQRLGSVSAVANPMIQINDQVRLFERITGDTYFHYVRGLSTSYDAEAGTYTMSLTTHWLGDGESWAVQ